ncbi:hypothetical protein ACIRBX_18960 [Kitasatospora sp. NPDC096147]|uniref:effector-associated constant component EACC1 n=1 Tax=Kitasatospora sp. NPDC096147 TaxID=3364093 RepID=UPI003821D61D
MEAWISVQGGDPAHELRRLDTWLNGEPALRGRIRPRPARHRDHGCLGSPYDVLVTAVGGDEAIEALAGSLHAFLTRPRVPGVRISVSCPEGRSVDLEPQRAEDVEALVHGVFNPPEEEEVGAAA